MAARPEHGAPEQGQKGRRMQGDARRRSIIDAARARAASGGWASVTTRALSVDIGFTQPVLYAHFPGGKADIVQAVAMEGFGELAALLQDARGGRTGRGAVLAVAGGYLGFAREHPAVYEAMFSLPLTAEFGTGEAEPEMLEAFGALLAVFESSHDNEETVTEVFWSTLHGVAALEASGRLRPQAASARLNELADRFAV